MQIKKTTVQYGRSMLEMLTVLAITGVLSVGAFVGYKTAMTRHRMNEVLEYAYKCAAAVGTEAKLFRDNIDCSSSNYINRALPSGVSSIVASHMGEGRVSVTVRFNYGSLSSAFLRDYANFDIDTGGAVYWTDIDEWLPHIDAHSS